MRWCHLDEPRGCTHTSDATMREQEGQGAAWHKDQSRLCCGLGVQGGAQLGTTHARIPCLRTDTGAPQSVPRSGQGRVSLEGGGRREARALKSAAIGLAGPPSFPTPRLCCREGVRDGDWEARSIPPKRCDAGAVRPCDLGATTSAQTLELKRKEGCGHVQVPRLRSSRCACICVTPKYFDQCANCEVQHSWFLLPSAKPCVFVCVCVRVCAKASIRICSNCEVQQS